jgi:single-strand DNA-binding protein
MMSIENHVQLIGNLGKDPETRYTQGGMAVTKISLATTSKRKDRDGNQREETQWHKVTFFGKLAEIAAEYLRQGSAISVQGSIRYSESEKDGVKRYYTDIIADQMKMLGGRPEGERTERAPREQRPPTQRSAPPPVDDFTDDDIPF